MFKLIKKKPNTGRMLKSLHESLIKIWKDCVRAFVLELTKHVHVDTGMSAASIEPLAARVGLQSMIIQSLRGKGPKRGHRDINDPGFKYAAENIAPFKSRALGKQLGQEPRGYELTFGSPDSPIFTFTFNITVYQWYLHDSFGGSGSMGDWGALESARIAFLETWEIKIKNFNLGFILEEII